FQRNDNDILLDVTINFVQATLGDKINVPTVDGDVELIIPAGTQSGKIFRMRGKGFPRLRTDGSNSGRGDQLVHVAVEIPTKLSAEQRTLFDQLAKTFGADVQPQINNANTGNGRSFGERLRDFFAGE
ncbi:MAG: molecular chaperone DnaJ, partial [Armatimonadetes bacterium]|nr:molecular chaperone DnaJ [Anaerolineae bacterium]